MASTRTFPIPDAQKVADKIKAMGGPAVDPTQPTGTASADGVTLSWIMQPDAYIQITIVKKPWIIPEGTIWSHVTEVIS